MKLFVALLVAVASLVIVPAPSSAADDVPRKGADVSWPNCPKGMGIPSRKTQGQPMPKPHARFVVIGLTNGPGFYPNPCIAEQVAWVRKRGLHIGTYAMTTYPKPQHIARYGSSGPWPATGVHNRLRNAGYAQATFNLDTMRRVGLDSRFVWVDVEHYPVAPWTDDRRRNRAVLDGVLRGYEDAGIETGFYTSPGPWRDIIGTARYGRPEWRTAGGHPWSNTSYAHARRMCRATSVQGGPVLMAQWWDTRRDYDVLCPKGRTAEVVERVFIQPEATS